MWNALLHGKAALLNADSVLPRNFRILLAPLKLRPYGAIQICLLLLLLLLFEFLLHPV